MSEDFSFLGPMPEEYTFYNGEERIFFDQKEHKYFKFVDEEMEIIPGVTTVVGIVDRSAPLMQWAANMATEYMHNWYQENSDCDFEAFDAALNKARMAHDDYKENAANIGKIAHDWLEKFIKIQLAPDFNPMKTYLAPLLPENEQARNGVHAALDWMKLHKVKWVYTERKIYSRRHRFAGTMDGLAYISSCGDAECCGHWVKHEGPVDTFTGKPTVRWVREVLEFTDALAVIDWKTSNSLHTTYEWQTAAYDEAILEELGLRAVYRVVTRLGKDDAQWEAKLLPPETRERDLAIFLHCLALHRLVKGAEEEDKQRRKEVRMQAKEDRIKLACPKSGTFKGFRFPKCNGGDPCETCLKKYNDRQAAKENKDAQSDEEESQEAA